MNNSILTRFADFRTALYAGTALVIIGSSLALAQTAMAQALPTGGSVSAGAATIAQAPLNVTVTQTSQAAAINWDSFSIAQGNSVTFVQPDSSSVTLNRVIGTDPSAILGNLNANGQVFVVNPNGVLFGQTAQVNVGGLIASTLGISDADFMTGSYAFSGSSDASVINQGTLSAAGGG